MMQFEVVFLLLFGLCHSAPHEGLPLLNPGGIGGIFKGPDSETIIRGPDGSEITSEEKGGAIVQDDGLANQPIVVAEQELAAPPLLPIITEERILSSPGPIIASTGAPINLASAAPPVAYYASSAPPPALLTGETYDVSSGADYIDAPLALPVAPLSASAPIDVKPIEIVEQDPHIIETEIVEAPDVEPEQSSDLKGPSGRIITRGSASIVSGPASTTITEPRKIIVAPPKIALGTPVIATATIPLGDAPLVAPLPPVFASTAAPLAAPLPPVYASTVAPLAAAADASFEASSTLAPSLLSYSTGAAANGDLGYSTTAAPLVAVSNTVGFDSSRINLGVGRSRESIPVIEYSSSNGVVNGQSLASLGVIASTEAPSILSSTVFASTTTDKFAPSTGPAVPAAYVLAPEAPANLAPTVAASSAYIQRIPRIEDNIAVDGRVGELTQNEIASYDSRTNFLPPPDLSQSKYIAPALARNGIDGAQVNLAPVPLSQVRRLPDYRAYQSGIDRGYLTNRYERHAKRN